MRIAFALALIIGSGVSFVSRGQSPVFRLPPTVTASDYSSSYVLVKLKSEKRNLLQGSPGGRVSSVIPGVIAAKHLVDESLLFQSRTAKGPRLSAPSIDMSLYYEVTCEAGRNIEDFINQLYQTDYFEIVEPAYIHKLSIVPSDPGNDQQYYLQNINAFAGWDITQGSETIIIAIVDTGGDLHHPDLVENLYTNPNDIHDGVNNDGDVYFDDYQGWDFVGSDTLNANNPSFIGDNDPGLTAGGNLGHGVNVAGCASARANNGIGISGVGYKTKLMFTKHTADNQKPNRVTVIRGYSGVLYAALKGAKIINCSWGSKSRSQIEQDIINYVTNDLGSLVVAAAGNEATSAPLYPAAYDNVLSVAATDKTNLKASFSNSGSTVDLSAPGVGIFTTAYNGDYASVNGTSFSSPIVAGAAALVLAKNPTFKPQQIAEQLRVSANGPLLYSKNSNLTNQLGKGLLDIAQALSNTSPSLRATKPKLVSASGNAVEPGQKGFLTLTINNILKSTSAGLEITITTQSNYARVTKATIRPGVINENSSFTNTLIPFEMDINAGTPENASVSFLLTYSDGAYQDFQLIDFILNPSFIDVNENLIATTVSSIGRIGYEDTEGARIRGSGFVFNQSDMIFEMGLIMGTPTGIANNVRSTGSAYDQDFHSSVKIKQKVPGTRSSSEVFGNFDNVNGQATVPFFLPVDYRSLVWKESPYDKFVIMEYTIHNSGIQPVTNFHFGIFADWDLSANGAGDVAKWDNPNKLGYVYTAQPTAKPYGGIQVLTGTAEYYAIDNDHRIAGNPFGIYDGFTKTEKYQTISNGLTGKLEAGTFSAAGSDVSHVVSTGPYTIPVGQEIKIAFALHAALNFNELQTSARYADSIYNYTLTAPQPVLTDTKVCYNTTTTLNASGAAKFKWYKSFTGGQSFLTGSQFTTSNLLNDTIFYVSNAEKSYESIRTPVKVSVKANPKILTSGALAICDGQPITLSVGDADTYLWSTGATTKSINVNGAGTFNVTVTDVALGCQATSTNLITTINPSPTSQFTISTGGSLLNNIPISFLNQSTGATTSLWDFGDGQTSLALNPSHTYTTPNTYNVRLTAYSDKGCSNVSTKSVGIVLGLNDPAPSSQLTLYPNPFHNTLFISVNNESAGLVSIRVADVQGNIVHEEEGGLGQTFPAFEIPGSKLSNGIYIVRVVLNDKVLNQRIVKMQ